MTWKTLLIVVGVSALTTLFIVPPIKTALKL